MVFPTFFNLSLNLAIRSSWIESVSSGCFCWLHCFSISGCREFNQSGFGIDHLVMSMCRVFSCVVGRGCCYDQCVLLAKLCYPLTCFILYSKAKFACDSRYLLTFYFCIPVSYDEKDIFFGISFTRSCRSSSNCSTSASQALLAGAWAWITLIFNGLPWKQTEIILLLLRLHTRTAFQTLCWLWGLLHFF